MAIEISEEIEFAAWQAYTDKAAREYDVDQEALRAALAAVAPLIEAQVSAENERLTKEHDAWRDAAIEQQRLHKLAVADLAQARADIEAMTLNRCEVFAPLREENERLKQEKQLAVEAATRNLAVCESLRSDLAQELTERKVTPPPRKCADGCPPCNDHLCQPKCRYL